MKNKELNLADLFKPPINQNQRVITKQAVNIHEFYLCGDIESAEEYIDWFDTIRSASSNDVIKIYINSHGGDLFTAIQFMRVLAETEGNVVISVEGACFSAATLVFLCAETFEVSEHSMFMFHNYSSSAVGKGGEMFDRLIYEREWSEKLFKQSYQDFLTDKEIQTMLEGKDIWMDGDAVLTRLKKRAKANKKELKEKKDVEA